MNLKKKEPVSAETALTILIVMTVVILGAICVAQFLPLSVHEKYGAILGLVLFGGLGATRPISALIADRAFAQITTDERSS